MTLLDYGPDAVIMKGLDGANWGLAGYQDRVPETQGVVGIRPARLGRGLFDHLAVGVAAKLQPGRAADVPGLVVCVFLSTAIRVADGRDITIRVM